MSTKVSMRVINSYQPKTNAGRIVMQNGKMCPTPQPEIVHSVGHTGAQILSSIQQHNKMVEDTKDAYTLTKQFLSENPTWAIDSLITYIMREYAQYGVTYKIISECLYDYVMDRY